MPEPVGLVAFVAVVALAAVLLLVAVGVLVVVGLVLAEAEGLEAVVDFWLLVVEVLGLLLLLVLAELEDVFLELVLLVVGFLALVVDFLLVELVVVFLVVELLELVVVLAGATDSSNALERRREVRIFILSTNIEKPPQKKSHTS